MNEHSLPRHAAPKAQAAPDVRSGHRGEGKVAAVYSTRCDATGQKVRGEMK